MRQKSRFQTTASLVFKDTLRAGSHYNAIQDLRKFGAIKYETTEYNAAGGDIGTVYTMGVIRHTPVGLGAKLRLPPLTTIALEEYSTPWEGQAWRIEHSLLYSGEHLTRLVMEAWAADAGSGTLYDDTLWQLDPERKLPPAEQLARIAGIIPLLQ